MACQTVLAQQIIRARQIEGAMIRTYHPLSGDSADGALYKTLIAGLTGQQTYTSVFYGFNVWRMIIRNFGRELTAMRLISKKMIREARLARSTTGKSLPEGS